MDPPQAPSWVCPLSYFSCFNKYILLSKSTQDLLYKKTYCFDTRRKEEFYSTKYPVFWYNELYNLLRVSKIWFQVQHYMLFLEFGFLISGVTWLLFMWDSFKIRKEYVSVSQWREVQGFRGDLAPPTHHTPCLFVLSQRISFMNLLTK